MPVVPTQFLRRSTSQLLRQCAVALAILTLSLIFATGVLATDRPAPLWLFDRGNSHDGNSPRGYAQTSARLPTGEG
jgi:hypothetical protein